MDPFEFEKTLNSLTIIIDTRENPNTQRYKQRVEQFPKWRRQKLDVGDYSCELNVGGELIQLPVAIERKMDLDEMCLCSGKQRKRFEKELERAKEKGIELYLLVEKASWGKTYEGDYRSKLSAKSLVGSLLTWEKRYKMPVHYCEPEFAAIHIRDILHYAAREWLSNAE